MKDAHQERTCGGRVVQQNGLQSAPAPVRRYLYTVPGLKCGYAFIIKLAPMGEFLEITDLSVRRPERLHLWLNSPLEKDKIYISTLTDCYIRTGPPIRPSSGT